MLADSHGIDHKKAANHYDYLVRQNMLPTLKQGGRVVRAQATTTNHIATTIETLLRNHTTWLMAMDQVRHLNAESSDKADFKEVEDYFSLNLDESNFMASDGTLQVIGSAAKKKQEKNTSDSRLSVTNVRIGSSAGTEGPRIYLAAGKELKQQCLKDFRKHHPSPPGSHIEMTPTAYMTDDTWKKMVREMCEGIREMPVIKDHPEWWALLSLDGFGSHLNMKALEVFAEYKILVVKEEGDSSQVCQAYDQQVARQDKRLTRDLLDRFRLGRHGVISQYELILVINTALNKADTMLWRKSHIRVNTCPSQLVPFKQ